MGCGNTRLLQPKPRKDRTSENKQQDKDLISSSIPQVSFAWLRMESCKENACDIYKVKDEFHCSGILLESPLIWLRWMDHMASPSSVHWGVTESQWWRVGRSHTVMRNGYELSVFFIYNQNVLWLVTFDCSGCLKERREVNLKTFIYSVHSFVPGLLWLTYNDVMTHTHRSERKVH